MLQHWKTKCCTDIFKNLKKESVLMMLIYEERGRRKERTVLLLLLFNTVSDENVIILKNVQRCFSFSKKLTICVSLKRNHFIYLVWYHLFLYRHWCTCHCFIIFLSLNDKTFFFKYCFCNFLPSQIRENWKKGNMEVKK